MKGSMALVNWMPCKDLNMSGGFLIIAGIIGLAIIVAIIAAIASVVSATTFAYKNPDEEE